MVIELPYGNTWMPCQIADERLGAVLQPGIAAKPGDLEKIVEDALNAPIQTPPLEHLLGPHKRVAIIIDDITRATPTHQILPLVIKRLQAGGIAYEKMRIVVALGTHRRLTPAEIVTKVGATLAKKIEVVNIHCDEPDAFVNLGETANRIPAEINRHVADADIRIAIGSILPHMDTGFSGGAKIVLPGVASRRTVNAFHLKSAQTVENQLGKMEAVSRKVVEQLVMEKLRLHFIVNVVMDAHGSVVHCVAGDFVAAHRRGAALARSLYGVAVEKRFPVVIANAYPMEIDFWQSTKAIWSGERITADGGLLVLVSPCPEGTGSHPQFAAYLQKTADELMPLAEQGNVQDPPALAFALGMARMRNRIRFALVSPGITARQARQIKMTPYERVEEALEAESKRMDQASVGVLPHGGTTLPLLEKGKPMSAAW